VGHSTDDRAIGIDRNRSTIPPWMSRKRRNAVYEMPDAMVSTRMPGSR
jgi:hypothetical protein